MISKNRLKFILFLCIIVGGLALSYFLGLAHKVRHVREWIYTYGLWAPVAYGVFYVLVEMTLFPGSILSITAGVLFGPVSGSILVSAASTVGAGTSFLVSRYLARGSVEHWLASNAKLRRLDQLTDQYGALIVAVTRLVPIFPFTLLNYAYGLTKIRFWTYLFWSWLCMIPGTILYVVGTDVFIKLGARRQVPWLAVALLIFSGAVITGAVRYARKRIK